MTRTEPEPPPRKPTRLSWAIPTTPAEWRAVAITLAGSVATMLLLEKFTDGLLQLIPLWLLLTVCVPLAILRWLHGRRAATDTPPAERTALPRPGRLVGRDGELRDAVRKAREHGIVVVRGVAGIGTSALAVAAGLELAPEPDAQRYADLRGQERQRPENPLSVARRVLRTLGLHPGQVTNVSAARREVEHALRDTGRLLLLDNVSTWRQVEWLPRQVPGAYILVAGEVDGIPMDVDLPMVQVGPLSRQDAIALLAEPEYAEPEIADRLRADPAATELLADRFLTRPAVAVGIKRWLAENPQVTIASLVADLEEEPHDQALGVVLAKLLQGVSPQARRLLGLLSHVPVAELGADAAAALAAGPRYQVEAAMDELSRHCLVEKVRESRVRVQDTAHAVAPPLPQRELDAAWRRLVGYFADRATESARLLAESGPQARRARDWFEIEDKALLVVLKTPPAPWAARPLTRIWAALDTWFLLEQRPTDRRDAARALHKAACALNDDTMRMMADLRLCQIALSLGDPGAAAQHLNEIKSRLRLPADVASWPAALHVAQAATLLAQGDELDGVEQHLTHFTRALPGGDLTGQATALINRAVVRLRRGQLPTTNPAEAREAYNEAHHLLVGAAGMAKASGNRAAEAHAAELLALARWYLGMPHDAVEGWREAADLFDRVGDATGRARCHVHEAAALLDGDNPDHARAATLLREAADRLPRHGLTTALAHLWLIRADPENAANHRKAGLAALSTWTGPAVPEQVKVIRRLLKERQPVPQPGG
ncbi:hypothetical protein AB0K60_10995 [Thermopolyspora sp. NPDC052614]|uniref:hypothetical protein n=1 Tax=Thermopolyspora sp. NPDC052614 TaxID=3155682 RepID=UPI0034211803